MLVSSPVLLGDPFPPPGLSESPGVEMAELGTRDSPCDSHSPCRCGTSLGIFSDTELSPGVLGDPPALQLAVGACVPGYPFLKGLPFRPLGVEVVTGPSP